MTISQRIFGIMEDKRLKQSDLADYIGISNSSVSDWKNKGSIPSADKIVKISEFLNVSIDYLLGKTNIPDETEMPTGDNNMIIGRDNNGAATLNSSSEIALGEMETELLKTFQSLSFTDKIDVLNYIINKGE